MKTRNKKLEFKKNSVMELNDSQLKEVKGGTTLVPSTISIIVTTTYTTTITTITFNEIK